MAEKTVATSAGKQVQQNKEHTRMPERYLPPPVDIYETEEGLVLLADLPGVSPNDLKIRLEDNILTIQASLNIWLRRSRSNASSSCLIFSGSSS